MFMDERGAPKKDDHYIVSLSFPDPNLMLPNNKKQVIQRLIGLKRRFIKVNKFFQDYLKFMGNLLRTGYAKRSDASPSGKNWYIPHHGVYHPSKPSKICVMFDCSAEFQGKSINKELLSGPDLTNQITGILTRFCEEKIAFMADVEAMYHQVQVPEDQQSFLKFMWWENHDIDREPRDYVMCAHVFGATSAASCSNYALRRTTVENEAVFAEAAASALHHNFYSDDLLKSIEEVKDVKKLAKKLVKDVINMHVQDWWLPSYQISNNKELLSVPEHQRRMGVKWQDLSGDLSNEKELGICWNFREEIFSFRLKLEAGILKELCCQ